MSDPRERPGPPVFLCEATLEKDGAQAVRQQLTFWQDAHGTFALGPAEVKQLGLTDAMREGIENSRRAGAEQSTRSPEVRQPVEQDRQSVSAEEWMRSDAPLESEQILPQAVPPSPESPISVEVAGGESVDGWRFWRVQDGDAVWMVYDNRPQVTAYWDDAPKTVKKGTPAPPELVQGVVPLTLVQLMLERPGDGRR